MSLRVFEPFLSDSVFLWCRVSGPYHKGTHAAETHAAGTSVSVVARRHDINANLLFRWRDDPRYAFLEQSFLPVEINTAISDLKGFVTLMPVFR